MRGPARDPRARMSKSNENRPGRAGGTPRVRPLVARTFPLDEAAAAQRYLSEERPFGKVVLTF